MARFGSLAAVLAAADGAGLADAVASDRVRALLGAVRRGMVHALRQPVLAGPVLSDRAALDDYLRAAMAHDRVEQVRVLFLDRANRLIADEVVASGTVAECVLHPREVLRRAIALDATALIVAHNHPSGDPRPSDSDVAMTRRLVEAARPLDIVVHDHVVVGRAGCVSMRRHELL